MLLGLRALRADFWIDNVASMMATLRIQPVLVDRIRAQQYQDPELTRVRDMVTSDTRADFSLDNQGVLKLGS